MSEQKLKIKVTTPEGALIDKEGTEVEIIESKEPWSEITLSDGTIFRMKQTVVQVIRLDNEFDPEGNPIYVTRTAPIMIMKSVAETLKLNIVDRLQARVKELEKQLKENDGLRILKDIFK